jgi:hypothetical protein
MLTAATCFVLSAFPDTTLAAAMLGKLPKCSVTFRESKPGTTPEGSSASGVSLKKPLVEELVGVGLPREGSGSTPVNNLLFASVSSRSGRQLAAHWMYSFSREELTRLASSETDSAEGRAGGVAACIVPVLFVFLHS